MASDRQHSTAASCLSHTSLHGVSNNCTPRRSSAERCRAVDFRHLLIVPPFVLDNLFSAEVDKHNRTAGSTERLKDPSSELVEVANTFIAWYKLYRCITPGKGIKQQGSKTNQGDASAQTMLFHSLLHKEASRTLCYAVQARVEDGEEACWIDSAGNPLRADRWWRQAPG